MHSKKIGTAWEKTFADQARLRGWAVVRIPDGCIRIVERGRTKLIPAKSPFDFILGKDSKAVFVDTKTYDSDQICYSDINFKQVEKLLSLEFEGFMAGYVVYFRPVDVAVFYQASILQRLELRESLGLMDGIILGRLADLDFKRVFE